MRLQVPHQAAQPQRQAQPTTRHAQPRVLPHPLSSHRHNRGDPFGQAQEGQGTTAQIPPPLEPQTPKYPELGGTCLDSSSAGPCRPETDPAERSLSFCRTPPKEPQVPSPPFLTLCLGPPYRTTQSTKSTTLFVHRGPRFALPAAHPLRTNSQHKTVKAQLLNRID